ncbi:unnamed protein product [Cuscuta campestris]|uniref:Protein phosphatase n=1 Tax=Cuscuta campestris TaxID=132261 RepID=A0A484NE20_9ASTE|nr:unnamed protein product [Cuscuta campestris]
MADKVGFRSQSSFQFFQGRLLLGHSRFFHSLAAAIANLYVVNERRNHPIAGAFYCAVYIPSLSGPGFQVCGYHINHLISYHAHLSSGIVSSKTPMAAYGSRHYSLFDYSSSKSSSWYPQSGLSVNSSLFSKGYGGFENFRKDCMSLRKKDQLNFFIVHGYFAYVAANRRDDDCPLQGFGLNGFHRFSPACLSNGTAPDVSFDNSVFGDQFANSADSMEEDIWTGRSLKLRSGSFDLLHPDKEAIGGEDVHVIRGYEQAIWVTDGVGVLDELGIDVWQYARELMSISVSALLEEPKGSSTDAPRVLEKVHMPKKAKHASTASVIALTNQALLSSDHPTSTCGKRNAARPRFYSSNSKVVDLRALKPLIMKKVQNWAKDYRFDDTAPVAREVLNSRALLYRGVSTLLHHLPVWACEYCPEVYIGERGHLIRTCCGPHRRLAKIKPHKWIKACLNDILVPVEAVRNARGKIRIPAVVELCLQSGATQSDLQQSEHAESGNGFETTVSSSHEELELVAKETLNAYETLRNGVQKLMMVFPTKVCKHCSEVRVTRRHYQVDKHWHEGHLWEKAEVDDLVPPKIVWFRRPQDPPVLLDEGRCYYGHAPAVIDMCIKAGAVAPSKYFAMMKDNGIPTPPV